MAQRSRQKIPGLIWHDKRIGNYARLVFRRGAGVRRRAVGGAWCTEKIATVPLGWVRRQADGGSLSSHFFPCAPQKRRSKSGRQGRLPTPANKSVSAQKRWTQCARPVRPGPPAAPNAGGNCCSFGSTEEVRFGKALTAQGAKRVLAPSPQSDSEPTLVRHAANGSAPEDTAVRLEDLQPLAVQLNVVSRLTK